MRKTLLCLLATAAFAGAGCSNLFSLETTTTPTDTPGALSGGQWASVSSTTTLASACTNFKWTIVDVSATSGSGTFTATCLGDMDIAGTAQGALSGTVVNWTAEATGATPDGTPCPISLTGTATYDGTQFRIPYEGTTCLGPVSGTEILRRN